MANLLIGIGMAGKLRLKADIRELFFRTRGMEMMEPNRKPLGGSELSATKRYQGREVRQLLERLFTQAS
jgi:hypothetical protein